MTQKLIIISGSPWVGKTTVADSLFESYENSAHLDGDWVWRVNPFSVSDPRLRSGDKNMSFVLSTYLNLCFEYVIFSSVVAMFESIRKGILQDITAAGYQTIGFTLTCSRETLTQRHKSRGDTGEVDFYYLNQAYYPSDFVINTDGKTVTQIVSEIRDIIKDCENHGFKHQ